MAFITWQADFVNRFVIPVIGEANQRLYRALDALISSPRNPELKRRHEAALAHEQRFGNDVSFGARLASITFDDTPLSLPVCVPPLACHERAGNSRAAGSRTRTTGSNAKKAASGSGGTDPDPEPRRLSNPSRTTSLIAANDFRMEVAA